MMGASLLPALRRAGAKSIDLVLPLRCIGCGATVEGGGAFCAACFSGLRFVAEPACALCGFPFEFNQGDGAICGACAAEPPEFDSARAVFAYDDASRDTVLAFKHADRTDAAPSLARLMVSALGGHLDHLDAVVPVPLHRTRLALRRYNQSSLLANALARLTGLRPLPDALIRRRRTPSQGGLSASARRRNVAGAFAVNPRRAAQLTGRRIVLIDEVYTTGATIAACTRALRAGGAAEIHALTLARVIRPGDP